MADQVNPKQKRSVFVRNLPFGATEEELKEVFASAGPVLDFRIATEKGTGKSRGFGFCEYADAQTASAAIRNITGQEFKGRTLSVSAAESDRDETGGNRQVKPPPQQAPIMNAFTVDDPQFESMLRRPTESLLEVVEQAKGLIEKDEQMTRKQLAENPSLARGILLALGLLGITEVEGVEPRIRPFRERMHPAGAPMQMEDERERMMRMERERRERERIDRERMERERIDRERMERDRMERERMERERMERDRMERERMDRERMERERMERERMGRDRMGRGRMERGRPDDMDDRRGRERGRGPSADEDKRQELLKKIDSIMDTDPRTLDESRRRSVLTLQQRIREADSRPGGLAAFIDGLLRSGSMF